MTKKGGKTKKPAKAKAKKSAGNPRIKQTAGGFWVLHKQHDVRRYKGFTNKADAEQFAAGTPVEKKVKITAEREKAERAKKAKKPQPVPPTTKKKYVRPGVRVIVLDQDPKIASFEEGRQKYQK